MIASLEEIQKIVYGLAEKIAAPISKVLTFGISLDDGTPCIQFEGGMFYYFARDRNAIAFRKETRDIDLLLYWVFSDITFDMAVRYEVKNRKENADPRRLIFSYQIELLQQIDPEWAKKEREAIDEILERSPYIDINQSN